MAGFHFLLASASALWRERVCTPTGIARLQKRRLARLVTHASTHVQIYRNLYAGIDPGAFELTDLPSVERAFLMEHFDDSIARRAVTLGQVQEFIRHGPMAGRLLDGSMVLAVAKEGDEPPGFFVTDRAGWERQRGTLFARMMRYHLLHPADVLRFGPWRRYRMAFLTSAGHQVTNQVARRFPLYTRLAALGQTVNMDAPLVQVCRELTVLRPHYVHGYPSYLQVLAHEQVRGRLRIQPDFISLGSELVSATARQELVHAFPSAEIVEVYGTTECMAMANQCRFGHMHINEDVCILENVDAAGDAVPEGQPGARILVTNLLNTTQPIIRYEVGDQVRIQSQPCPCGFPFRRVEVLGRAEDTFFLQAGDGTYQPHAPVPLEEMFHGLRGMRQCQLVHESQNLVRVSYTRDSGVDAVDVRLGVQQRVGAYLEHHGLDHAVQVLVEEVAELSRDPHTGKLRHVISRVPRPPDGRGLRPPWQARRLTATSR